MMRIIQHLCCVLSAWLLFVQVAAQQQTTHKVLRKETAYGIARTYGVDLNALYDANPWAESGIRKGDVLRIPQIPAIIQYYLLKSLGLRSVHLLEWM